MRSLLQMLNQGAEVPSADTVRDAILAMFIKEQDNMRKVLQETPGKISFTLDAWTSRNQHPFLGIKIVGSE